MHLVFKGQHGKTFEEFKWIETEEPLRSYSFIFVESCNRLSQSKSFCQADILRRIDVLLSRWQSWPRQNLQIARSLREFLRFAKPWQYVYIYIRIILYTLYYTYYIIIYIILYRILYCVYIYIHILLLLLLLLLIYIYICRTGKLSGVWSPIGKRLAILLALRTLHPFVFFVSGRSRFDCRELIKKFNFIIDALSESSGFERHVCYVSICLRHVTCGIFRFFHSLSGARPADASAAALPWRLNSLERPWAAERNAVKSDNFGAAKQWGW